MNEYVTKCLPLLLRPLVKFCVRHAITLGEVVRVLKAVFVEVAQEQMLTTGHDVSASRISVMSGVHRKDVATILRDSPRPTEVKSVATRVIGHWQQNSRYCTTRGKGRVLSVEGRESEFSELVRSISEDVNPYTVLFELERTGAVERTKKGLKLKTRIYIPSKDLHAGCQVLANDQHDILCAVEENLLGQQRIPNLHIRTEYDNIPLEAVEKVRTWCFREGSQLHERARDFFSKFDRDIQGNLSAGKGRFRVVLGAFSRTENILEQGRKE